MTDGDAAQAIETAARDSYGRLVAWLASRAGGLAAAEDAVADALEAALRTWPERGVPDNPEAWLLTAARRKTIDRGRQIDRRVRLGAQLRIEAEEVVSGAFRSTVPDRRLELMFVCTHPDLPKNVRTPLILQTVLGLSAERIAGVMLDKPSAIAQRLVRAKQRIERDGIPFEIPPAEERTARLGYVLDAIYAAFGAGFSNPEGADASKPCSAHEALWLARLVIELEPGSAEAKALYALMLYAESRRRARLDADGRFVPLDAQDPARWDHRLIEEAEKALWMAAQLGQSGAYQLEAAIQSHHADRARTGRVAWDRIHQLYRLLSERYPSVGAVLGYAATFGRLGHPERGLEVLRQLPSDRVARHQPYWAVKAHLLARAGRGAGADEAYERAMGLTSDAAVWRWLNESRSLGRTEEPVAQSR